MIRIGGQAVLAMEVIFAGSMGAFTFNLPPPAAVALGVTFMLVMTSAIKAMLSMVQKGTNATPSRIQSQFIRVTVPVSLLWLIAVYVLVTLTRPGAGSLASYSNVLFPASLALLTAVSPALGALLLSIASLVDWAKPFVDHANETDRFEARINLLIARTRAPRPDSDWTPPPPPPAGRDTAGFNDDEDDAPPHVVGVVQ